MPRITTDGRSVEMDATELMMLHLARDVIEAIYWLRPTVPSTSVAGKATPKALKGSCQCWGKNDFGQASPPSGTFQAW